VRLSTQKTFALHRTQRDLPTNGLIHSSKNPSFDRLVGTQQNDSDNFPIPARGLC
jgi:hypothetical protein